MEAQTRPKTLYGRSMQPRDGRVGPDDGFDADLRRALEMSLEDSKGHSGSGYVPQAALAKTRAGAPATAKPTAAARRALLNNITPSSLRGETASCRLGGAGVGDRLNVTVRSPFHPAGRHAQAAARSCRVITCPLRAPVCAPCRQVTTQTGNRAMKHPQCRHRGSMPRTLSPQRPSRIRWSGGK